MKLVFHLASALRATSPETLDVAWGEPCRLNEYLALLGRAPLGTAGTLMCCYCALSSCSLAMERHGFPIWDTLMAWKFST